MRNKEKTRGKQDILREISLLIRSRYGLIWLKTSERDRMESLLWHVAESLGLRLFIWTPGEGMRCRGAADPMYGTGEIKTALAQARSYEVPAVYCFHGIDKALTDPAIEAQFVEVVRHFTKSDGIIVMTGRNGHIPEAAQSHTAVVSDDGPDLDELRDLVKNTYRDLKSRIPVKIDLTGESMNRLLRNLRGLTTMEAEKLLTRAMIEDGRLDADDIESILDKKKSIVEKEGLLEFTPAQTGFQDIADLTGLKGWLAKRKCVMTDPDGAAGFGLPFPKGILLLGVPGSGKSLCAKAVAAEWGLPLLKMDPSRLYNKYIGESEKNYRRAMETAERLSPVVLWIDEIEKAFPPDGGEDSGVSQRVLGSFLTWLQERRGDVFVAATANDIDRLPPPLLRKGRFDEVFFVDLPDRDTRREIFRIHISRRGHKPAQFDLDHLADVTDGFTAAEIEQAVVAALYTAFSGAACLTTDLLESEIRQTRPLSVIRAEYIQRLRQWASGRTVSAH
jgi:SpoVK/Ycf46/Vps4 family AAA+-type ATPase